MKRQDKNRQIFNEGFEQLILPHFETLYKSIDDVKKNMAAKEDIEKLATKEDLQILSNDVDSIKRTLNSEISWRDDASKRLKKVEVKLGFVK